MSSDVRFHMATMACPITSFSLALSCSASILAVVAVAVETVDEEDDDDDDDEEDEEDEGSEAAGETVEVE